MLSRLETEIDDLIAATLHKHEQYVAHPDSRDEVHAALTHLYADINKSDAAYDLARRSYLLARLYNMPELFTLRIALLSYNAYYATLKLGYGSTYVANAIAYQAAQQAVVALTPFTKEVNHDHG